MRILLNYEKADTSYLSAAAHIIRGMGFEAVGSATNMTISELMAKAKAGGCHAIVCCNEQTLRYLVPGEKPTVDKWRGSRLRHDTPVLIVNKLAHIHTVKHGRWLFERDLQKLKRLHEEVPPFRYKMVMNARDMEVMLEEASSAVFMSHDIETKTLKPEPDSLEGGVTLITCAGWTAAFADGSLKTYVLPFIDYEGDHWKSDREYVAAIKCMKAMNALPIPKVMHNGMYDATHTIRYHAEPHHYTLDTMYIAHAEFSELPKSLDFVASYWLPDYIYWKDEAEAAAKRRDQTAYWAYNARDTWYTARVLIAQLRGAAAYTWTNFTEAFPLAYPALYCNFEGFRIDQGVRAKSREKAVTKLEAARARLQVILADENFNPGSWQQVAKYLYEVFGAQKPRIGKSKSATDEKNLLAVAEQHPILARITDEILSYREAQKAIGTYYDFLQFNGRLLWALDPFGTETGRFACRASSLWVGTQVQNVPGYAKDMLIADEGFEIFEADNKQSEGRTTAYCSQEEALIAALENAEFDFYKQLGTLFFQIPYEEVTDFFRNKVLKKIVHGTNYMMGAVTFIENIGARILYQTAQQLGYEIVDVVKANNSQQFTLRGFAALLLDTYHEPFAKIRPWYQAIKYEVSSTGFLVSPLGHTRRFFGNIDRDHSMLRGAVAHQPQNLSGTVLNKGVIRVYRDIVLPSGGDFRIKAQVHDSILGQWRKDRRDEFAARLADCMYNPVKVHGRTMVIPIDIKHGNNWAEQDENNPGGTVKYKAPV